MAQSIGVSRPTVWRWQQRFAESGVEGLLRDKTRKPGKAPLAAETTAQVVALTCTEPPRCAASLGGGSPRFCRPTQTCQRATCRKPGGSLYVLWLRSRKSLRNLGVGLVGALVGGLVFRVLGIFPGLDKVAISLRDVVAALVGSLLVLAVIWLWQRFQKSG